MLYHTTTILLFRPFISHTQSKFLPEPFDPLGSCTSSAVKIVALAKAYRSNYSLRTVVNIAVHCVFTAATIHLSNVTSTNVSYGANARHYLGSCMDILEEMGQTWPSAQRCLHVVHSLMVKYKIKSMNSAIHQAPSDEEASPKDYTYEERCEQRLLGSLPTMPQLQAQNPAMVGGMQAGPSDTLLDSTLGIPQPQAYIPTDFDMAFFDVPDMSGPLYDSFMASMWNASTTGEQPEF